jgi:hypothetical protein
METAISPITVEPQRGWVSELVRLGEATDPPR